MIVVVDIETVSQAQLLKVGAYNYASHPSTELVCLAYSLYYEEEEFLTFPTSLTAEDFILKLPAARLFNDHLRKAQRVVAHNSAFERYVWAKVLTKKYNITPIDFETWECTMARCAYYGLPLALPKPDAKGQNAMKRVCVNPEKEQPGDKALVLKYNEQDIIETLKLFFNLPPLPALERDIWLEDQRINDTGIPIDTQFTQYAASLVEKNKEKVLKEFQKATNYEVRTPGCLVQFMGWLESQGSPVENLQEPTVTKLINNSSTSSRVKMALKCRAEYASVSIKKYDKMNSLVGEDGYARGQFQYSPAITHRWGGRGFQPQNLPTGTEEPESAIKKLSDGNLSTDLLVSGIRGAIKAPPGKQIVCADLVGIEPRIRCWLADDQPRLEQFRNKVDTYLIAASVVYNRKITKNMKKERLVGKINELAFGYGGGYAAVNKFATAYKLDIAGLYDTLWAIATPDEKDSAQWMLEFHRKQDPEFNEPERKVLAAEILKIKWRNDNPKTKQLWEDLESAMRTAIQNPGKRQYCCNKKISYLFNGKTCMCYIPGCNEIIYRNAKITEDGIRYTHGSKSVYTYGGKLCENVCQAIGRNVFVELLFVLRDLGFEVFMHVHDEFSVLTKKIKGTVEILCFILECNPPKWAEGIPIMLDGWEGERYKK